MIPIFFKDYISMTLDELIEKYSQVGMECPTADDILDYLTENHLTRSVVDIEPIRNFSRAIYLVEQNQGSLYQVFNFFRNDRVMETDFKDQDKAIIEKLNRVLGSIRSARRS